MNGDTQIIVSGREYKVPGNIVTYEQVVKIWNELHEAENKHIIGTPGIDYEDSLKGEDGVLLPGKDVEVKDGTSFLGRPRACLVRDRLSTFAEQAGFAVRFDSDVVLAVLVPCLLADGVVGTCTIEKSYDPTNGKPNDRIGGAVHAVRITADEEHDGRVYHADGNPIESYIDGDGKTWSNISIRKGSQNSPEEDVSASDLIHRYAKQIVGAVSAAGYSETASLGRRGPFKIPNTFEARAAIGSVQDRIRDQSIAIIGLGGTGAYVPRPYCEDASGGNPSFGFRRR